MRQNETKSGLKPKQRKLAQSLADPASSKTISEVCGELGVSRATFYRWMEDSEFTNYLDSLIDKYSDSELAAVWKALIHKCKTGDTQAIKLYFELKGKYKQGIANEPEKPQIVFVDADRAMREYIDTHKEDYEKNNQ